MKKNSKDISQKIQEIDEIFSRPPTTNQKAWGMINDFYNFILFHMEENKISKSDLAKKLGKSRSAISQMFNKTPNITVRKMVEIADSVGLDISIMPRELKTNSRKNKQIEYKILLVTLGGYKRKEVTGQSMLKIGATRDYLNISCNKLGGYLKEAIN